MNAMTDAGSLELTDKLDNPDFFPNSLVPRTTVFNFEIVYPVLLPVVKLYKYTLYSLYQGLRQILTQEWDDIL